MHTVVRSKLSAETLSPRVIYSFVNLLGIMHSVSGQNLGVKLHQKGGGGAVGIPVCVKCLIGSKQTRKRSQTLCLGRSKYKDGLVFQKEGSKTLTVWGKILSRGSTKNKDSKVGRCLLFKEQRASQCGLSRMGEESGE